MPHSPHWVEKSTLVHFRALSTTPCGSPRVFTKGNTQGGCSAFTSLNMASSHLPSIRPLGHLIEDEGKRPPRGKKKSPLWAIWSFSSAQFPMNAKKVSLKINCEIYWEVSLRFRFKHHWTIEIFSTPEAVLKLGCTNLPASSWQQDAWVPPQTIWDGVQVF